MRWVDSDSSKRRRRERPGLGWPFWWGAGSDRDSQPRIVPKWMTGQMDFAFVQIKLAWPSDSVASLQTQHLARCS